MQSGLSSGRSMLVLMRGMLALWGMKLSSQAPLTTRHSVKVREQNSVVIIPELQHL